MSFAAAVNSIPSVSHAYRAGLRALGANSVFVSIADTRDLNGSVDIDASFRQAMPDASRWDYIFGYKEQAYYLEVHPAGTNEVDAVIKKLAWLKVWLRADGAPLSAISAPDPFHWIASGKVAIIPNTIYARRLAAAGLSIPKTRLVL